MDPTHVLQYIAFAAIAAACIGLIEAPCPDANCRSVHKQHREREREQRALAFHRANHGSFYDPACRHCVERREAGGKP